MTNIYYTTSSSLSNVYTISAGSVGSINTISGSNGTLWSTSPSIMAFTSSITGSSSLSVNGDLEVDGNIKVKGKDLFKLMEQIENRLAIITDPNPKKLEKFESLKKAYDHYRLMEKLIGED